MDIKINNIYNIDALQALKLIPNNSIDLIITDPPYRTISGGRPKQKGQPSGILSKNDGKIFEYNDIKPEVWLYEAYRVLKEDSHCYIMANTLNIKDYLNICEKVGFKLHNILIWEKNNSVVNRWYMKNCEYTLFLRKGKAKPINNLGSKTVHQFNNILGNKQHPTEKPLDLMKFYIENSSNIGNCVLDPFMGAGSTILASKELKRNYIGFELDKTYFDIAEKRLDRTIK